MHDAQSPHVVREVESVEVLRTHGSGHVVASILMDVQGQTLLDCDAVFIPVGDDPVVRDDHIPDIAGGDEGFPHRLYRHRRPIAERGVVRVSHHQSDVRFFISGWRFDPPVLMRRIWRRIFLWATAH